MNQLEDLIQQARSAAAEGNRLVAYGYWRRATRIAPDRLDLWQSLLQVAETSAERKRCLENILRLDPTDVQARSELAQLEQAEQPVPEPTVSAGDAPDRQPALPKATLATARADITEEMRLQWDAQAASGQPMMCVNHPQRQTALRCNSCGAPICSKCAVRTPVGFRCKACIQAQQAVFYTSPWYDYPLAAVISFVLSVPAAAMVGLGGVGMSGWWFALIVSPLAGGIIGGIVHWAVGRRRGRWTWLTACACIVLGALAVLAWMPYSFLSVVIYAVTAATAAMGVLRLGRYR